MCGIAGIVGAVDEHALRRMTQVLHHRGPDGGGVWISEDEAAGFGHRRLKIIDLSDNSRQPMVSADGRFVLTYNGEIFNYRELRRELVSQGHRFRSESDSEVLLYAYAEWGRNALDKLVGQFAFAIWDTVHRTLFAARDHLGVKPFYYAHRDRALYFASEVKAILGVLPDAQRVNLNALPQYLSFLWVPGSRTMFEGIRKLEPGTFLQFDGTVLDTGTYWDPLLRPPRPCPSDRRERVALLRQMFDQSVQSQLVSDVPLGLLLSGGLDSTAILSAMHGAGRKPKAFTATYSHDSRAGDVFEDDLPHARSAAAYFGADLQESFLEAQVAESLPRVIWHLDEPLADPTTLTNEALTRAAKPSLTVLLTGMGADEIFAGYPRYPATLLGESLRWIPAPLFRFTHASLSTLLRFGVFSMHGLRRSLTMLEHSPKPLKERFLGFSSYVGSSELHSLVHGDVWQTIADRSPQAYHHDCFDRASGRSPLQQMLYVDMKTYLPNLNLENMDKTSMANSVEMRVPFLDHRLVELALSLPDEDLLDGFRSKILLRKAFEGRMPAEILARKKTGYNPPIRAWMRGSLKDVTRDVLLSDRALQRGIWNPKALHRLLDDNDRGFRDNSMKLWSLLVFESWLRVCIENGYQAPRHDPSELIRVYS